MQKNKWYLKKINSDNFNLSMISLDSAYAIEQLMKNKNQLEYKEYLKNGILLLNLLKNAASNQINNSKINDDLLNRIVENMTMSLNSISTGELIEKLSGVINDLESENYSHDYINFFMKIYDSINKSSSEIVL